MVQAQRPRNRNRLTKSQPVQRYFYCRLFSQIYLTFSVLKLQLNFLTVNRFFITGMHQNSRVNIHLYCQMKALNSQLWRHLLFQMKARTQRLELAQLWSKKVLLLQSSSQSTVVIVMKRYFNANPSIFYSMSVGFLLMEQNKLITIDVNIRRLLRLRKVMSTLLIFCPR